MLTCVSSSDDLLQNLVFERPHQSLNEHIVVGTGGESYQGGGGGCAWQADLDHKRETRFLQMQ